MKHLLMIIAVIGLAQATKAANWQYLPENLSLVEEKLSKDLYKFENKLVSFSIAQNRQSAHLQIMNNVCPQANGGIACLAMPAVALSANYTIVSIETDACGIETLISNNVEVGSRWMKEQRRFAQIKVIDYSKSTCEMVYPADVQVELQDTMVETESDQAQVHFSTMLFNYLKVTGPVEQ